MRARRPLRCLVLAFALAALSAAATGAALARATPDPAPALATGAAPPEERLREAVGNYGFLCAACVQVAILVAVALGRSGARRRR